MTHTCPGPSLPRPRFLTVTGSFRSCFLGLPLQHLPAQPPAALASPELASLMQAAEGLASSGPLHAALKAKAGAGPAHAAAPWQVQALAGFLAQGRGMFDTPGLFVRSAQQVLQQAGSLGSLPALGQGAEASAGAAAGERPEQAGDKALWRSRPHLRALLQALAGHVDALSGTPGAASVHQLLSSGAGAHAAAALLLAAFGEQPSHVVPLPLSEMCNVQVGGVGTAMSGLGVAWAGQGKAISRLVQGRVVSDWLLAWRAIRAGQQSCWWASKIHAPLLMLSTTTTTNQPTNQPRCHAPKQSPPCCPPPCPHRTSRPSTCCWPHASACHACALRPAACRRPLRLQHWLGCSRVCCWHGCPLLHHLRHRPTGGPCCWLCCWRSMQPSRGPASHTASGAWSRFFVA